VLATVCAVGVVVPVLLLGGPVGVIDQQKAPRDLARILPADHEEREVRLAAFDWFQPSLVFYTRREIERPAGVGEVRNFLLQPLPAYLFVPEQTWREIQGQMPAEASIVGQKRDLYTGRVIVVVTNEGDGRRAEVRTGRP